MGDLDALPSTEGSWCRRRSCHRTMGAIRHNEDEQQAGLNEHGGKCDGNEGRAVWVGACLAHIEICAACMTRPCTHQHVLDWTWQTIRANIYTSHPHTHPGANGVTESFGQVCFCRRHRCSFLIPALSLCRFNLCQKAWVITSRPRPLSGRLQLIERDGH